MFFYLFFFKRHGFSPTFKNQAFLYPPTASIYLFLGLPVGFLPRGFHSVSRFHLFSTIESSGPYYWSSLRHIWIAWHRSPSNFVRWFPDDGSTSFPPDSVLECPQASLSLYGRHPCLANIRESRSCNSYTQSYFRFFYIEH